MRSLILLLVATLLFGRTPLAAQQASPYVPLAHWAMPYVEYLIASGAIEDPTPLTRPFKQADLVRALQALDTTAARPSVTATVRRLLDEFTPRRPAPFYRIEASTGVAAATYAFRDPVELGRGIPARREDHRAFVSVGLDLRAAYGPFVAVTHPVVDTRLQFDPDWPGKEVNTATRNAEAYVTAQWRLAELFFGQLDRNWGPSGMQGLLLSDEPYGLDHLGVALGTPRAQLQAIATQLDTRADATGALVNRFMVQHRLYLRPARRWTLALWDGLVTSGVARQLEPWYLNIVNLSLVATSTSKTDVNTFVGLDVERRGATTLFGQFMLDDIQVSRKVPADLKPTSYGLSVGAKGRLRRWPAAWTVFYTQVANLTYRNEDNLQIPLYRLLGTGRNFADHDQATLKASVLPRPSLLVEPEITLLRQGEGDPRLLHPLVPQYPSTATLFQGVVERTVRLALGGSWQLGGVSVTGNGGVHFIRNAGHITGASETRWLGSIGLTYRLHYENALP